MRFQRLIPDPGSAQPALTFHPRLTVLTGLDREGREAVTSQLLGAMAGTRRDVRLDLLDDTGRHLSVRRPGTPDGDKVLNLDNAHEVSLEFLNGGALDLLHGLGLDVDRARRRCRLSPDDITAVSRGETLVASLATRDQGRLWAAAERLRAADIRLAEEMSPAVESPEDVAMLEDVERRHADCERRRDRYRTVRRRSVLIGVPALAAAGAALTLGWMPAIPLVVVGVVATALAVVARWRLRRASVAERDQLAVAGGLSYIGFRLQRLNERLDRQEDRATLKAAAAERQEATAAWQAVAGGASADAALAMRARIKTAAERLAQGGRLPSPGADVGSGQASPAELAEALMIRMADLRHVVPEGESCPLILDEPLAGIDLAVKQWMLELVARTAGSPQIVYLTADPDVAAWARIEALVGQLEVVAGPRAALEIT